MMKKRTGSKVISRVRERERRQVQRRLWELRRQYRDAAFYGLMPQTRLVMDPEPERPSLIERIWRLIFTAPKEGPSNEQ